MTFDLAVLIVIAAFAIWGAFAGVARQVAQLVAVIGAWAAATPVGQFIGPVAATRLGSGRLVGVVLATFVAFLLVFLVVRAVVTAFVRRLLAGKDPKNRTPDRVLGFLLGAAKVAAIVYVGLAAATFFEDNVTLGGRHFRFSPRGSVLFSLARDYNLFEAQQFSGVKDFVRVARLGDDPKMAGKLKDNQDWQALKKDSRFTTALDAQSLQKAIETGDYRTLLKSNQVLELISDPAASRRLERIAELSDR